MFKLSEIIVINPFRDGFIAFNPVSKEAFQVEENVFRILDFLRIPHTAQEIAVEFPEFDQQDISAILEELAGLGAVLTLGSEQEVYERNLTASWKWGTQALGLHLSTRDMRFVGLDESEAIQRNRSLNEPMPSLTLDTRLYPDRACLKDPIRQGSVLELMAKRRTVREVESTAISLDSLGEALFAGLGIVGETQNCVGKLPLKMTPSGGARNPFEAFVFANRVDGLPKGIYHYSGVDHSLGRVSNELGRSSFSELIGNQDWADEMPALVILVAYFERTMWKYRDSNAYRVVLIEAGHIGQNMMLAATESGLTACPTAALAHSKIEAAIGLKDPLVSPVYAILMGKPLAGHQRH